MFGQGNFFDSLPEFSAEKIEKLENMVTATLLLKYKVVKKIFNRQKFSPSSQMTSFVLKVSVGIVLENIIE